MTPEELKQIEDRLRTEICNEPFKSYCSNLIAEVRRLREALEYYAHAEWGGDIWLNGKLVTDDSPNRIARKALEEK